MRLTAFCSAGGSAFFAAFDMAREAGLLAAGDVSVIVDRPCGAQSGAEQRGLVCHRIEWPDRETFEAEVLERLEGHRTDLVLLFFLRLLSQQVTARQPTLNIHPSLLPAFPGFGAVQAALDAGTRMIGATLHVATDEPDAGPILAQVASPLAHTVDLSAVERLSFLQKTYLALLSIERGVRDQVTADPVTGEIHLAAAGRVTASAAPALEDPALIDAFSGFAAGHLVLPFCS